LWQLRDSISRHTPLQISSEHVKECRVASGGGFQLGIPSCSYCLRSLWREDFGTRLKCLHVAEYLHTLCVFMYQNFGMGIEYFSADELLRVKSVVTYRTSSEYEQNFCLLLKLCVPYTTSRRFVYSTGSLM
jgi:hypothetical protein